MGWTSCKLPVRGSGRDSGDGGDSGARPEPQPELAMPRDPQRGRVSEGEIGYALRDAGAGRRLVGVDEVGRLGPNAGRQAGILAYMFWLNKICCRSWTLSWIDFRP